MIKKLLFICLLWVSGLSGWCQLTPPVRQTKTVSVEMQIRKELETALEKFRNEKSDETVWKEMRRLAEDVLFNYFQKGKLAGTKKDQAYFIKIGLETMTAADIKAQKKILLAGLAIHKPGEFIIIRIEK